MSRSIHDLPHSAWVRNPKLPKSNLLTVRYMPWASWVAPFRKMRFANAMAMTLGRFDIVIRMPWMAGPARQLHPHLFPKGDTK